MPRKAALEGGQCLDDRWQGQKHHYRFRCLKEPSHEWRRIYSEALKVARCPHCQRAANGLKQRDAQGLQRLQAFAASKGGECLSPSYLGVDHTHRFRCAKGHTWEARATGVLSRGNWCHQCCYDLKRIGIDEVRRAAEARGGRCLAKAYRGGGSKYPWLCARGHAWSTTFNNVVRGYWCPTCSYMVRTRPGSAAWWRYQPHGAKD